MDGSIIADQTKGAVAYRAPYVWMISTVAALGGLLFGYDFVVIGGAKPFYESYFQLHSEQLVGWANSCALLFKAAEKLFNASRRLSNSNCCRC